MTTERTITGILAIIFLIGIMTWFVSSREPRALGAATPGLAATVSTTSPFALAAATAATVMGTTTCAGGTVVVTTQTGAFFTFDDRYSPTLSFGLWQAPSTTVAYDSALYGCGKLKAMSAVGQTLTVSVTQ